MVSTARDLRQREPERHAAAAPITRVDVGLFTLRGVMSIVYIMHGGQKLFVQGLPAVTTYMAGLGIPLPGIAGPLVALVEFLGGIALLAGVLTRVAALLLACDMAVAILVVHLPNGFFLPRGFEYPFTLIGGLLAVILIGPGRVALQVLWRSHDRS